MQQATYAKITAKEAITELAKVGLTLERSEIANRMREFYDVPKVRVVVYADTLKEVEGLNANQKQAVQAIGVNETSNVAAKFVMCFH